MISFFQPFGCFFGSHELYRDRDDHGALVDRCLCCGHVVPILHSSVVRGPQAVAREVLGQPLGKAIPANKVTSIKKRSA